MPCHSYSRPGPALITVAPHPPSAQSHGVLANTAIVWTFLLSAAIRLDNFTLAKAAFCLVNFAGVASDMVARNMSAQDEPSDVRRWWGAYLAIGSALFYALYTCMIKAILPNDEKVDMVRSMKILPRENTLEAFLSMTLIT